MNTTSLALMALLAALNQPIVADDNPNPPETAPSAPTASAQPAASPQTPAQEVIPPQAAPAEGSPTPVLSGALDNLFTTPGLGLPAAETPAEPAPPAGEHWALIVCGHPGDDEHRETFAETIETLYQALTSRYGFAAERVVIQFGSQPQEGDGPALSSARGEATADELQAQLAELAGAVGQHDTLWTIVMGHAHYDGRNALLNLPGADVHQDDFAAWFVPIKGRQVFFITTPVSGFFIRPLSAENRIVITATQADLEVNETLYPLALAQVLAEPPEGDLFDVDRDGVVSLFDLYLTVSRNVAQRYLDENLLATEHALLDDNGDSRGTELQIDYLTVELGGRASDERPAPKIRPNSDGARAIAFDLASWGLPIAPAEEPADAEATDDKPADDKAPETPPDDDPANDTDSSDTDSSDTAAGDTAEEDADPVTNEPNDIRPQSTNADDTNSSGDASADERSSP